MTTITHATAPSLTFDAFDSPHGRLLPEPLILLEVDALPTTHRLDKAAAFAADVNLTASPIAPYVSAWRPCTPGANIVVEAVAGCPWTTVYVQSSADGITTTHSVAIGNLWTGALCGFRFRASLAYFRILLPIPEACRVSVRTQQRA